MATTRKPGSSSRRGKSRTGANAPPVQKRSTQTAPRIPASVNPRSTRGASRPKIKQAGSRNATSTRARSGERRRLTDRGAEISTSRMPSSKRPAKRAPARKKRPRTGTTPGGSPSTVLPATKIANTDVAVVPPPPDELPEGGAIADTDGLVRDVTGEPAENVMPLESLEPGEDEEPFDPPADSNAGSPGADVENPADDSYTKDQADDSGANPGPHLHREPGVEGSALQDELRSVSERQTG